MKRLVIVATLALFLVGLVLLGLSDTAISIPHIGAPNNEATSSISKADNSSATATITITMYTVDE